MTVVGSLNMDLIVDAPRLPSPGETLAGTSFVMAAGGKGHNQAVAAARSGARTALVGCRGPDEFGRALDEASRAEGVDTTWVRVGEGAHTGVAQIVVREHGQNSIIVVPGANSQLDPGWVGRAMAGLGDTRVVLTQLEVPLAAAGEALALGRRQGALTMLNPAPAQPLEAQLLAVVDLCLPNEVEATQLTGVRVDSTGSALRAAADLRHRGCRAVLVTMGPAGAVYSGPESELFVPPLTVRTLDTVGAGDAFCGALAAALASGDRLHRALPLAAVAGALATTRRGATSSIPSLAELEATAALHPELAPTAL